MKKGGMSLASMLGSKPAKADDEEAPESESYEDDEESEGSEHELAGQALLDAFEAKDPAGLMEALKAAMAVCRTND